MKPKQFIFMNKVQYIIAMSPLLLALAPDAIVGDMVRFVDITSKTGITFRHINGASKDKPRLLPMTMGSGVCVLDVENDGLQDLLFVNGTENLSTETVPTGSKIKESALRLYHNNGNWKFSDITQKANLDMVVYGMGCAVADYDDDGAPDLFVTALGQPRLFHNDGKGIFTDVTKKAGITDSGWSTAAAWLDYDRDGDLDLFVGHYFRKWTPDNEVGCSVGIEENRQTFCGPNVLENESPRLYRNNGSGTFTDVSNAAGIFNQDGRALGVALLDYNNDGWIDIVVANDAVANFLYRNNRDGTFVETALQAGIAYDEKGIARNGMGVDVGDYDNDNKGNHSILIGNDPFQGLSLYKSEGQRLFRDHASQARLVEPSLPFLTFGVFFFDYDLDGWLDAFIVNGLTDDVRATVQKGVTYEQRPLLFHNLRNGQFEEAGGHMGLDQPLVGRGAAYGDLDNDGDLDVVITVNRGFGRTIQNGVPLILRNDGGNRNHKLRVKLIGTKSNRDAIGAVVKVAAGSVTQSRMVKTGSSYLSQSELPLIFGLSQNSAADELEIRWPSGLVEKFKNMKANQSITVQEGKGIIASENFK